jgi:DNA-binding CsgD family transcriptional regulator
MDSRAVTERCGLGRMVVLPPGLAGREQELAVLSSALNGPPAVVIVEGEAGIGKSRLVREFLASPAGRARKVIVAACPPLRRPHTLGPVADALRAAVPDGVARLGLSALAGALRPLFPEWEDHLPPPPGAAEDSSAVRHRVFTALAELMARLDIRLLVAEDVHWADEATVEFLLTLASQHPRPIGLVVTCRPEDVPTGSLLPRLGRLAAGSDGLRIVLCPLDMPATTRLMSSMLAGEPVSPEFAAFVHEHTEGVPLAVEELVRLLAARGDVFRGEGGWVRHRVRDIRLPAAVRDAVLERAARLGPDAQAVLNATSVLAAPAGEATIAAVVDIPAQRARAGLCEALACGLLAEDGHGLVAFRHELAALAVYEAIPGPDRRAAHWRAGYALECCSSSPPARLVRHFREARDTSRWRRYGEQAADLALAAGDEAGAGMLLCDLIANAGPPPSEVTRLADKIVPWALRPGGELRDLAGALRALADSGNLAPREEAEVRVQLGWVLGVIQEHEASRAEMQRALPMLQAGSPHAIRALRVLGWPMGTTHPAREYLRWLRLATRTVPPDPMEQLRLAVSRTTALLALGQQAGWAVAELIPSEPSEPRERAHVTAGHGNIGEAAMIWGHYREATKRLAHATELASRYEYPGLRADALAVRAHLDWFSGAWEGLAYRAAVLAEEKDLHVVSQRRLLLITGLLHGAQGDRAVAQARMRQVLDEARGHGAVDYLAEPAAGLARLALTDGDAETALRVTDEPAGIVSRKGTWVSATELAPARAEALLAAGRAGEAGELVAAFARGLHGRDAPAPKAGLALCRAILAETRGQHARAAPMFGRAAAAWEALPRPYEALLARERQARCLLAVDSAAAGVQLLGDTLQGLSDLGAVKDADRVARELREHGTPVAPTWRGGRRSYGGQLSPREREVVRLAAAGHTNREIAAALYRSPHTVSNQLRSAMRKLGVSSRALLAVPGVTLGSEPYGTASADEPRALRTADAADF